MKKIEILAPAGNEEMLRAAVFAGADAVYLGLKQLNARRGAGNFDAEGLCKAAAFCRARNVRIYLTLNTTPTPAELPLVHDAVKAAAQAGVDALIVQDLAVASLARRLSPGLALHGSTQMSIHSPEGVLQAAKLGFSRVIPARELSLAEIAQLCKQSPIEIEVFIHGALCMGISGQCYLSAFLGGRSGNRGACAGPCRLPFSAGVSGECHLSLKDHSHIDYLPQLAQAGVASVKIEGRLRSPEYVAAAVNACCSVREGKAYNKKLLQQVFSRSGFTDGYLSGKRDAAMFGVRTQQDIRCARKAEPQLRALFRRENHTVGVTLLLEALPQEAPVQETFLQEASLLNVVLTACDDDGNEVCQELRLLAQPAEQNPQEAYRRVLQKTGGTPFFAKRVLLKGNMQLYIPTKEIAALRRRVLEQLLAERQKPRPAVWVESSPPQLVQRCLSQQSMAVRFETVQQLVAVCEAGLHTHFAQIQLAMQHAETVPEQYRSVVWLEPPRCSFGEQEETLAQMARCVAEQGFAGFVVQNLSHLHLLSGYAITGGFGLNITNPAAALEYCGMGLRMVTAGVEVPCAEMAAISAAVPTAAIIYGHLPVMITRACPLKNVRSCEGCSHQGELIDRKQMRFPVRCSEPSGLRTIYNPIPLYAADRAAEIPADMLLLYFTIESPQRAVQVAQLALAHDSFDRERTRGLLFRARDQAKKA